MKRKSSLALMFFTFLPIVFCGTLAQAQSSSKTKAGSESTQADGQDSSRIVSVTSQQSFDKTYETLKDMIESKGLKVLAEIDHAKNAKTADMTLPPTKVILFGNPKMGTPLMKANQSMALDLPQRDGRLRGRQRHGSHRLQRPKDGCERPQADRARQDHRKSLRRLEEVG